LIVDYGSAAPGTKSTLQAVRAHKYDDPFAAPGEADITAHVDFAALARAATEAGAAARPLMRQGEFLIRLGLVERANVLGRDKDTEARNAIAAGIERLAGPKAMGDLFKVLAISAPGLLLPVFDPYPEEASQ
jgi:SAM-dependent MidA family methyltransferase